jgi:hypothetical protein
MSNGEILHSHRGYTIRKHDTGGRRMGREITYRVMLGEKRVFTAHTLSGARVWVDAQIDTTDEQRAERDALAAAILSGAK